MKVLEKIQEAILPCLRYGHVRFFYVVQKVWRKNALNDLYTLSDGIIEKFHSPATATPGRPSQEQTPLYLIERHFPEFIPSTSSNAKSTCCCHVCYSNSTKKQTHYICSKCGKSLCAAPCF